MSPLQDVTPYMNPAPFTVSPNTHVSQVFNLFRTMGLRHLPVVNAVGEVSVRARVPAAAPSGRDPLRAALPGRRGLSPRKEQQNPAGRLLRPDLLCSSPPGVRGPGVEGEAGVASGTFPFASGVFLLRRLLCGRQMSPASHWSSLLRPRSA